MKGINDRFALKVIVGDDKSRAGTCRDFANAHDPGIQLFGGVKIVVAFVCGNARVVGEPGVIAAAVQADVADGRSGLGAMERPMRGWSILQKLTPLARKSSSVSGKSQVP